MIQPAKSGKTAVIIGAGPAGLTAAYELLKRTDITPIVLERGDFIGGISRTVNYKGNRMDIGGHRFFSKSDRVMDWWFNIMPVQALSNGHSQAITYQRKSREVETGGKGPDPEKTDLVMLVRERKSRIYFLRQFFDYPITLSKDTVAKLGLVRMMKIGVSYMKAVVFPIRDEKNLEQFFINRFGRELYLTFFKSYTEKVWGVPCEQINADWGKQRIKGLSITKTITHILKKTFGKKQKGIGQKKVETSLIEQFIYPKLGPGQMWEEVAKQVQEMGGRVMMEMDVEKVHVKDGGVVSVDVVNRKTKERTQLSGDYFFSTMAVRDLVNALDAQVPVDVREVSDGLMYRDFITVGLLVSKLKIKEDHAQGDRLLKDNWIYIQEPDVQVGRLQIFNNWSPYMVADRTKVWIGMEYFCYETDDLWKKPEKEMVKLAVEELDRIGIIEKTDVLDATVIHVPKTYPAYFGTYDRFDRVREYIDEFENLFLIGRNGMHRYNNQDHSMLTAMTAVDNIIEGKKDKSNIWAVNTEQDYHEEKK